MTTSLSYDSSNHVYFAKNVLTWKSLPKTRSHDILAIGINNAATEVVSGSERAYSNYTIADECLCITTNNTEAYTATNSVWKKGASGYGVIFKLPNDQNRTYTWSSLDSSSWPCVASHPSYGLGSINLPLTVQTLSSTLYFNLAKVGNTSPVSAYGSYRHAKKNVSVSPSIGITIQQSPVISISASVQTQYNYDTMSDTHAQVLSPQW